MTAQTQCLAGNTALVTGSTSGIGEAIAATLAAHGAAVVVCGRDTARGGDVVKNIVDDGGTASFLAADLGGSYEQLRSFAAEAESRLGHVDILVNNAGVYPATLTADLPDADLDTMLAVNIRAPHVLVAELAPKMAQRGTGAIVNIGSWMATVGSPFAAMYTATKAADEQLTRSWAAEFGPHGVRVNTVAPGATLTPGNENSRPILDAMTANTPAGVPIDPQDIANAVLFLVSNDASKIHGITLNVDGGIAATRMPAR